MERSNQSGRGVWTRAKTTASVENDSLEVTVVRGTSVCPVPPLHSFKADNRKSQELEMCRLKMEWQKEKIDELTRERDYLQEDLALEEDKSKEKKRKEKKFKKSKKIELFYVEDT